MILLLVLYLLIGVALAELMRRERSIDSWEEYVTMMLLHPIVIISAICLVLYDYWRDKHVQ